MLIWNQILMSTLLITTTKCNRHVRLLIHRYGLDLDAKLPGVLIGDTIDSFADRPDACVLLTLQHLVDPCECKGNWKTDRWLDDFTEPTGGTTVSLGML